MKRRKEKTPMTEIQTLDPADLARVEGGVVRGAVAAAVVLSVDLCRGPVL
jgi:hypothetical protein